MVGDWVVGGWVVGGWVVGGWVVGGWVVGGWVVTPGGVVVPGCVEAGGCIVGGAASLFWRRRPSIATFPFVRRIKSTTWRKTWKIISISVKNFYVSCIKKRELLKFEHF